MRAAVVHTFGDPATLVVDDVADPVPGPGEVLIEVAASGVGFPDVLVVAGTYQNLPPRPFSPGKEVCGTVRAWGPRVTGPQPGTRVIAQVEHGGYAELVTVSAEHVVPVPDTLSDVQAASLGLSSLTAHVALHRRARLRAGEVVLVTGANGAVGAAAVQLAAAWGARVLAVVRDPGRAALSLGHGADHVLVAGPSLREEVRDLTDGHGADVVVETVGGDVFDQALRATAWEGRLATVGFASGEVPAVRAGHLLVKNISVLGLQVSDYRDREPATMRSALGEILSLHADGRMSTAIARAYPLDDAARALDAVQAGGLAGRVVLTHATATATAHRGAPS